MAILKIYTFPDEVLRQKALPIEKFDKDLETLASDMLDTMYDAPGVGLAANQVGVLKRIFVLDVDYSITGDDEEEGDETKKQRIYKNKNSRIIINPEITETEGNLLYREGCLSVPGFSEEVKRFSKLELAYHDLKGKKQTLSADGLLAVAIQHEMDHLDGRLYVDRLSQVKKQMIRAKVLKERKENKRAYQRSKFHVEL